MGENRGEIFCSKKISIFFQTGHGVADMQVMPEEMRHNMFWGTGPGK